MRYAFVIVCRFSRSVVDPILIIRIVRVECVILLTNVGRSEYTNGEPPRSRVSPRPHSPERDRRTSMAAVARSCRTRRRSPTCAIRAFPKDLRSWRARHALSPCRYDTRASNGDSYSAGRDRCRREKTFIVFTFIGARHAHAILVCAAKPSAWRGGAGGKGGWTKKMKIDDLRASDGDKRRSRRDDIVVLLYYRFVVAAAAVAAAVGPTRIIIIIIFSDDPPGRRRRTTTHRFYFS